MSTFNYEIIHQYVSGELKGEELRLFEQQLINDEELAKEVTIYKTIETDFANEYANINDENKLRQTLTELGKKNIIQKETKVVSIKNRWWLAASVAAAAALVLFVIKPWKTDSTNAETLFADNISKIETLSSTTRGNDVDSLKKEAATYYNAKEFTKALPLLNKIASKDSSDKNFILALGICQLQTNEYSAALNSFSVLSSGNSTLKYEGVWYEALTMLKQKKLTECNNLLNSLPESAYHYKDAIELIAKIKQIK